ncbi:MAG: alcohol dehydrogenase catalytic domain-containing protein, partial [Proteobacteria bacterium]|nr:alcohol dehydrogenase catalytic domain-containing protein [Pseudomonadota bacterium]
MKCVEIRDRKLFLTERPVPRRAAGEVLVRVHAAGVNRPDLSQRNGSYPPPPGVTDIPGLEIAGEIVESSNWSSTTYSVRSSESAAPSVASYSCASTATSSAASSRHRMHGPWIL